MMNGKVFHSNTLKPLTTATPIMAEINFHLRRWRLEGALARTFTSLFKRCYLP